MVPTFIFPAQTLSLTPALFHSKSWRSQQKAVSTCSYIDVWFISLPRPWFLTIFLNLHWVVSPLFILHKHENLVIWIFLSSRTITVFLHFVFFVSALSHSLLRCWSHSRNYSLSKLVIESWEISLTQNVMFLAFKSNRQLLLLKTSWHPTGIRIKVSKPCVICTVFLPLSALLFQLLSVLSSHHGMLFPSHGVSTSCFLCTISHYLRNPYPLLISSKVIYTGNLPWSQD